MLKKVPVVVAITLGLASACLAQPIPYPVFGFVYLPDGATPLVSAAITLMNLTTAETWQADWSNSEGWYQTDLGNFPSGWAEGDSVRVSASGTRNTITYTGSYYFTPTWYEWSSEGGHYQDIITTASAVVPEPTPVSLVGAGLFLVLLTHRRFESLLRESPSSKS